MGGKLLNECPDIPNVDYLLTNFLIFPMTDMTEPHIECTTIMAGVNISDTVILLPPDFQTSGHKVIFVVWAEASSSSLKINDVIYKAHLQY